MFTCRINWYQAFNKKNKGPENGTINVVSKARQQTGWRKFLKFQVDYISVPKKGQIVPRNSKKMRFTSNIKFLLKLYVISKYIVYVICYFKCGLRNFFGLKINFCNFGKNKFRFGVAFI